MHERLRLGQRGLAPEVRRRRLAVADAGEALAPRRAPAGAQAVAPCRLQRRRGRWPVHLRRIHADHDADRLPALEPRRLDQRRQRQPGIAPGGRHRRPEPQHRVTRDNLLPLGDLDLDVPGLPLHRFNGRCRRQGHALVTDRNQGRPLPPSDQGRADVWQMLAEHRHVRLEGHPGADARPLSGARQHRPRAFGAHPQPVGGDLFDEAGLDAGESVVEGGPRLSLAATLAHPQTPHQGKVWRLRTSALAWS